MVTKITVSASINAPVEKVWDCFTNPSHIVNWNFASDDWHCPRAENDLRIGGKYNARMEAKDGSFGFDFITIYTEVEEYIKLSYTMEDGREASTIFESTGNQTNVTTIFDAENENPVEAQQQGWQMILNNFKKYTEKQ
ncbi:MAG: SRPBCC family protein [Bacteroidetes bacterium]|nr:SRPBCC family protein [Bacteroidota bacterium]